MRLKRMNDTDAFGQEIWYYYKKAPSFEVVERDDGYVGISKGAQFYFSQYNRWGAHEKRALKYVSGRCLDVGCGAGRVLLYLQNKNIDVVGIDYSPLAIKVCKLRGAKDARHISLEQFIKSYTGRRFDTILMFYNGFGLFGRLESARAALRKLHNITSKDATIITETRDPYKTKNRVHFKYYRNNKKQGKLPGTQRVRVRFMQYATNWFNYLYVSRAEMEKVLSSTGWAISKVLEDPQYEENGEYIAIIKKKQ